MHRARFVARETNNPFAQITMELLAHAVQPIRRVAGIQVRRPQGFPFRQRHFARQIERLGLQIATAIGFHLRPQAMVTAQARCTPQTSPCISLKARLPVIRAGKCS